MKFRSPPRFRGATTPDILQWIGQAVPWMEEIKAGLYRLDLNENFLANTSTSSATGLSAISPINITGTILSHDASGVTPGTYRSVAVNSTGHVTSGSNPVVDISTGTNLAVTSPITLTGDTVGFDFSTNNTWTGTNRFNENVGMDVAPEASAGKLRSAGAAWFTAENNAFGVTTPYTTLVLDGGAAGGGLYAIGRVNPANQPFVALSGYDPGSTRDLYYGGGGWGVPDAMVHLFYAAASYTEATDTGVLQLRIDSTAVKPANHVRFTVGTSQLQFRNGSTVYADSPTATSIRMNAATGGSVLLAVNGTTQVTANASGVTSIVDMTISKDKPTLTLTDTTLAEDDYYVANRDGTFQILNTTDSRAVLTATGAGTTTLGSAVSGTTLVYNVASSQGHEFQINSATELTIRTDTLTLNNGATDTGLDWTTDGVLRLFSGATYLADFTTGTTVFNEDSADLDFRFEGNADANLLFLDAGNDRIGVGNAAPSYKLDVTGQINASEDIAVASDKKVYLEGMTGDTHISYVSGSTKVQHYVNGVLAMELE